MKIVSRQQGGLIYTPFIRETPKQAAQTSSTSESNSKKSGEIEKAIIDVLNENGLQNDVDYFLSKANALLTPLPGFEQSYSMSDLIQLHSLANRIKRGAESEKTAIKRLETENSGSEVAITNTGNLYVRDDDGQLRTISISSYYNNKDKYQILTQADLLNIREFDPNLAYNSTILNDLSTSIGMSTIVKQLESSINAFGTETIEDKSDKLTVKEKGKVEKGMENILDGASPDGVYNITTSTTSANQGYSDVEGMFEAAAYL